MHSVLDKEHLSNPIPLGLITDQERGQKENF